jgi:kynurenine formamidase
MKCGHLPSSSLAALICLLMATACSAPSGRRATSQSPLPEPLLDLDAAQVVDLTYPFDEKTLYWPTAPSTFKLQQLAYGTTPGGFFYSANSFCTPEHGGTHLDAPIHFGEGQRTADQVPVDQLIGRAVVIDVAAETAVNPNYQLTREDVLAWEGEHGAVPRGAIVLLRTGWGKHWPDPVLYLGDDTPGDASNLHFPSYGADAAAYLVGDREVGALGVDTASIDPGDSRDFPVHRIAALANVPGLENVANLERLPATGAWVIALPMKIAGGSGGPLRIVALIP